VMDGQQLGERFASRTAKISLPVTITRQLRWSGSSENAICTCLSNFPGRIERPLYLWLEERSPGKALRSPMGSCCI